MRESCAVVIVAFDLKGEAAVDVPHHGRGGGRRGRAVLVRRGGLRGQHVQGAQATGGHAVVHVTSAKPYVAMVDSSPLVRVEIRPPLRADVIYTKPSGGL